VKRYDWRALAGGTAYDEHAQRHRPDAAGIAAEVQRLAQQGLTPRDIASALRVNIAAVLEALRR
jgi:transposase-like protein